MALRKLKLEVLRLLEKGDLDAVLRAVAAMPARQVINPLFGLLYHGDPQIRWYAVAAMGEVVARLAAADLESARVIMRRLMWNLNDESGGIGWGAPEAMGEIMARHGTLAQEYGPILISYLDPCGNYLEHEGLQAGLLWAVGRVARVHPDLMKDAAGWIAAHLTSESAELKGLALWSLAALRAAPEIDLQAAPLLSDYREILLFQDGILELRRIADLAADVVDQSHLK